MKYQVWLTRAEYGLVHVDAESEDEALNKAEEICTLGSDDVCWFENELIDMEAEEV